MTKPITENYELAQQRITEGAWAVDPDQGIIYNTQGKPYSRKNTGGYIQIKVYVPGEWPKARTVLAHRVIYERVHGMLSDDMTINHINGDHTDNRIANLEAMSQRDNVAHAVATGLYHANCVYCRDHGKNHSYKVA